MSLRPPEWPEIARLTLKIIIFLKSPVFLKAPADLRFPGLVVMLFKQLGHFGNQLFYFEEGGVYAKVIVELIPPPPVGVKLIVFRPFLVKGENVSFHFLFGQLFVLSAPLHTALNTAFDVGVNKNSARLVVSEYIVGTPAHDNAVRLFGHTLYYFALGAVDGLNLLEGVFPHIGNALSGGYGIEVVGTVLDNLLDVFLRKRGVL